MSLLLALLLLGGACASFGLHDNAQDADRLDKMEQLLRLQNDKISEQESVLHQQNSELASLRQVVRRQSSQLSLQQEELSFQKSQNSAQDSKLSVQEDLLRHQAAMMFSQNALLRQLAAKLSLQDEQHQEKVANMDGRDDQTRDRQSRSSKNNHARAQRGETHTTHASSSRISARADDISPLEATVSQLSQQVAAMAADIQALKNTDSQLTPDVHDAATSTFTQWGNSRCSDASAHLVYSGVMGGSWSGDTGGAANFLCLSLSPVPAQHPHVGPGSVALLYGAEYQTHDGSNDMDAVCAVCRASYSTTVMIPGTNACVSGWHRQYQGYLMSDRASHNSVSEFICVDSALEKRSRSGDNNPGKQLFFTRAMCGSLPCLPYQNGTVVSCVVCSK